MIWCRTGNIRLESVRNSGARLFLPSLRCFTLQNSPSLAKRLRSACERVHVSVAFLLGRKRQKVGLKSKSHRIKKILKLKIRQLCSRTNQIYRRRAFPTAAGRSRTQSVVPTASRKDNDAEFIVDNKPEIG